MSEEGTTRHYALSGLAFRDLWDICVLFQQLHPEYKTVHYSVETRKGYLAAEETNLADIVTKLSASKEPIRKLIARFDCETPLQKEQVGASEMIYRPEAYEGRKAGLTLHSEAATKLTLCRFEEALDANYELAEQTPPTPDFGTPIDVVVAALVYHRFSAFVRENDLDGAQVCGLLSLLRRVTAQLVDRFPPDQAGFLSEGVLLVWRAGIDERQAAIDTCAQAFVELRPKLEKAADNPLLTAGVPAALGLGMATGKASRTATGGIVGEPRLLAESLAHACPPRRGYCANIRDLRDGIPSKEAEVMLDGLGTVAVEELFCL